MSRIFYPAIFHAEPVGYSVSVPDVRGCFSEGDTLDEAYDNIMESLGLYLEDTKEYPKASIPQSILHGKDEFIMLLEFDPLVYKRKHDNRSIKKTLTIPAWLNAAAEEKHINFSSVLQNALKQQLDIDE